MSREPNETVTTEEGSATSEDVATREVGGPEDGGVVNEADDEDGGHLDAVPTGAGCTEIWEALSEQREAEADPETEE